jgi:hypothetical protein
LDQHKRPFFRTAEGGIDESLLQVEATAEEQVFDQGAQNAFQTAFPNPLLESAMARLVRRVLARQVAPAGSGSQDPEHAVEHRAGVAPGPTASVGSSLLAQQWPDYFPLRVAHVHASDLL